MAFYLVLMMDLYSSLELTTALLGYDLHPRIYSMLLLQFSRLKLFL